MVGVGFCEVVVGWTVVVVAPDDADVGDDVDDEVAADEAAVGGVVAPRLAPAPNAEVDDLAGVWKAIRPASPAAVVVMMMGARFIG